MKPDETKYLLLDDHRGIYIPSNFASNFDMAAWHVNYDDVTILREGPNHEHYWDVWADVIDNAYFVDDKGTKWTLEQDGDLWAISEHYNHEEN